MKSLVIVESPTKAKTIRRFLSDRYVVDSSMGHVRDLPASAKEIPAKYKKEKWSNLGIDADHEFQPLYIIPPGKKKIVDRLKKELREADELILATDEDREGEGISWHLTEVLKPKVPVKRMVFHEITEEAIREALQNFRVINMNLVNAQEARRILDRLAGYTLSPLLWKKIAPGLSAGRVQSVAVKLLVDRERERIRFKSGSYWDLQALLAPSGSESIFQAVMTRLNDKRIATGKDFDENTGHLKEAANVLLLDEEQAVKLRGALLNADWTVTDIEHKTQKRSPAPPFITSTLQQEANRKFGFSAKETMSLAQKLYENGFITYMRTDSTNLSDQAIHAARQCVRDMYGEDYLYKSVRTYAQKAKGAQEAHEAIRPAGSSFRTAEKTGLKGRELKMYDLIWKRTVATQMANAELEFTNVTILAEPVGSVNKNESGTKAEFKASGKKILFPGFFRAYVEGTDDPDAALENQESQLPALTKDQGLRCTDITAQSHATKPPARFTEASLVKELEKEGVGRPSTYATIISTISERGYSNKEGSALIPTFTAFAVTELLERHFPDLVDIGFTSEMENRLDEIASGKIDWTSYMESFYKGDQGLKEKVDRQESHIDSQKAKKIDLPIDGLGDIGVFIGRFGPYVQGAANGETVSTSLPNNLAPSDITVEKLKELLHASEEGPQSLGNDPESGNPVYVLTGRYGPYVQLGMAGNDNPKPKRVSLLRGMNMEDVDLEMALRLLALPRLLGMHPQTGKEIKAGVGRYGPFVVHDGTFASLTRQDNVLDIDLDRAVELLEIARKRKSKKTPEVIKDLGKHPEDDQEVKVLDGRYGPYIKHGKKNISLSRNVEPAELTLEEAVQIISKKEK